MRWLQLMLGAMVANGFALLGAKVLSEAGLANRYQSQYLLGWYSSGVLAALLYSLRDLSLPSRKELLIGGAMACMSFAGQICLVAALNGGASAYLVFPIASGANVLFVAVLSVFLFGEKLGGYGVAGIFCGLVSVTILSLP
jgi:drug/metabolite transporter (DMT)-like permease